MRLPLSVILLLAACTGEPPEPGVMIGQGDFEWADMPADEVLVIEGPQGGFHLLGSMRIKGLDTGDPDDLTDARNPTTAFSVLVDGTEYAPGAEYTQGIDPMSRDDAKDFAPWSHEMLGRFVILDIEADDELDGAEVVFSVTVRDADGIEVSDEVTRTAVPHPANF